MSLTRQVIRVELGDSTNSETAAALLAERMREAYPTTWGIRNDGAVVLADAPPDAVETLRTYARGFVDALEYTQ
jgi:hypothetical protein